MRDVCVVGAGMSQWGEIWRKSFRDLFVDAAREAMAALGRISAEEAAREPDHGARSEDITTVLDVREWFDRKWDAVLAHHTHIAEDSWFRTLPDDVRRDGFGLETFTLVFSRVDADPAAPDLFAGLR